MQLPEKDEEAEVLLVCSACTSLWSGRIFIQPLGELFKTPKPLKILIYRNRFNGIERESFEKHEEMLFLNSKAFRVFFCFTPLVKDINFDHCLGGILQLLLTQLIGC